MLYKKVEFIVKSTHHLEKNPITFIKVFKYIEDTVFENLGLDDILGFLLIPFSF